MAKQNFVVVLLIAIAIAVLQQLENNASASTINIMPRDDDDACTVGKVKDLPADKKEFKEIIKLGRYFIRFFNPECNPCVTLKPIWQRVAAESDEEDLCFGDCNCVAAPDLCELEGVSKVPNLTWYDDGEPIATYQGNNNFNDIMKFVKDMCEDDDQTTTNSTNSTGTPLVATRIPAYLIVVGSVAVYVN